MKSVLISIRPKWCEKIASGEKTIEVRKTAPKEVPFKCYIYCTKEKPFIQKIRFGDIAISHTQISNNLYNGKVIGEFICDKAERFSVGSLRSDDIEKLACLSYNDIINYFYKPEELDGKTAKQGFAWHISDLKIYDKPKELSEFRTPKNPHRIGNSHSWILDGYQKITRPPQSWQYVEELKK